MAIGDVNAQMNPYIQWLLSRVAQPQGGGVPAAAQPLAALQSAVAPPNPVTIQALGELDSAYGGDLGLALRVAQRSVPGSFAGADVFNRNAPVDIASLMQQPSTISSRDAMSSLRNALAIGNYQYPDMSRDNINAISKAWEDLNAGWSMTGDAFKASYDPVAEKYGLVRMDGMLYPADPNNPASVRMAGIFNLIATGSDADAIIAANNDLPVNDPNRLNLNDQDIADMKEFDSAEKSRNEAAAKIAADQQAFAGTYGLPSPGQQWNIPPEVAGLIYQRQKTGLTDAEAAQQEADITQARYVSGQTGYVPKTREQIRAEILQNMNTEAMRSNPSESSDTAARTRRSRAEAAVNNALSQGPISPFAAQYLSEQELNSPAYRIPKDIRIPRYEIDRMVEARVRSEGVRAMSGERAGNTEMYADTQRAKRAAREAAMRQEELANQIASDLTNTYGTPFEAAIIQARGIVNANSKNYARPSGPTTNYPMGAMSTQSPKQAPKIQRMSL